MSGPPLYVTVICEDCDEPRERQWRYGWQTSRCKSCAKLREQEKLKNQTMNNLIDNVRLTN